MKCHDPSLDDAASTRPRETLVRHLLCDLGIPLLVLPCNFCFPMKPFGIQLCDFFHTFHEAGKFLKVRPLRVGGILRYVDFNGLFNGRHTSSVARFLVSWCV